jgi:hypothetical protein
MPDEKEWTARMCKALHRCDQDSESHYMMEKAVNYSNYLINLFAEREPTAINAKVYLAEPV